MPGQSRCEGKRTGSKCTHPLLLHCGNLEPILARLPSNLDTERFQLGYSANSSKTVLVAYIYTTQYSFHLHVYCALLWSPWQPYHSSERIPTYIKIGAEKWSSQETLPPSLSAHPLTLLYV